MRQQTTFAWAALLFLLAFGCGSTTNANANANANTQQTEAADRCADQPSGDCGPGCVFDRPQRRCRPVSNECEAVQLPTDPLLSNPNFQQGDPCATEHSGCAYDLAQRHCVPFVPLAACPPTFEQAQHQAVHCMHPDQTTTLCEYSGSWCHCRRPSNYCGGAAPTPDVLNQPTYWDCQPDLQNNGCPTRTIEPGAPCTDRGHECVQGCHAVFECRRGRWVQSRELPPRP